MEKRKWLQGAIRRPGKLTAEAKSSGRSKMEQAQHDATSSNPHVRARGLLGERLIKRKI